MRQSSPAPRGVKPLFVSWPCVDLKSHKIFLARETREACLWSPQIGAVWQMIQRFFPVWRHLWGYRCKSPLRLTAVVCIAQPHSTVTRIFRLLYGKIPHQLPMFQPLSPDPVRRSPFSQLLIPWTLSSRTLFLVPNFLFPDRQNWSERNPCKMDREV